MAQSIKPQFIPHAYALILLRATGYPCVFYGDLYGTCDPHPSPPKAYGKLPDLVLARKLYAYGEQVDYFDRPDCIGWVRLGAETASANATARSSTAGMVVMVSWVKETLHPKLSALHDMSVLAEGGRISGGADGSKVVSRVRHGFHLARKSWHGLSDRGGGSGTGGSSGGAPVIAPQAIALAASPRKRMFVGIHRAGQVWKDLLGWEWAEVRIDRDGYGIFPCQKNSIAVFVPVNAEGRERFPVQFDANIYRR